MTPAAAYRTVLNEWRNLLPVLDSLAPAVEQFALAMHECWLAGGKVMFAGNGGSCADAMHFAEELVVRYRKNRRALAAISLTDSAAITCCGNDFGFDDIFARQVDALGKPGDVLVAISTSGNSKNIIKAVEIAKSRQIKVVTFLGKDGGALRNVGDVEVLVPSANTARIQEVQKMLFHAVCDWVDERQT